MFFREDISWCACREEKRRELNYRKWVLKISYKAKYQELSCIQVSRLERRKCYEANLERKPVNEVSCSEIKWGIISTVTKEIRTRDRCWTLKSKKEERWYLFNWTVTNSIKWSVNFKDCSEQISGRQIDLVQGASLGNTDVPRTCQHASCMILEAMIPDKSEKKMVASIKL